MTRVKEVRPPEGPASPRDIIAAILTEAVPADDERRAFHVVYLAYMALSLTDPAMALSPLVRNSSAVTDVVATQLRTAQSAGDAPASLDPDLEALSLMSLSAGLATSVLAGHSTPDRAQAVIDYHLRRLFPPGSRRLRRECPVRGPSLGVVDRALPVGRRVEWLEAVFEQAGDRPRIGRLDARHEQRDVR
jgi:hypothetical protein